MLSDKQRDPFVHHLPVASCETEAGVIGRPSSCRTFSVEMLLDEGPRADKGI